MAQPLRAKRKAPSVGSSAEEQACPVCMEGTEAERFCFPCGHWICAACNEKMLQHNFLACPTCRTPREGVSQRQVDSANDARVARHAAQEGGQWLTLRAQGQEMRVMFFQDESGGANPFGPLLDPGAPQDPTANDRLLAQATEAASVVRSVLPHLSETSGPVLRLNGPMRALVDRLLSPGSVEEFLAQREVVRRQSRRRRRRDNHGTAHP